MYDSLDPIRERPLRGVCGLPQSFPPLFAIGCNVDIGYSLNVVLPLPNEAVLDLMCIKRDSDHKTDIWSTAIAGIVRHPVAGGPQGQHLAANKVQMLTGKCSLHYAT
jgi:hypothetical protein